MSQAYLNKPYEIVVPETTMAMPAWLGASYIIAQYNYTAETGFVLADFFGRPMSETCVVCIKWRTGFNVRRYLLWSGVAEFIPSVSLYQGEFVRENFCIEVWSVNSAEAEVDLPEYNILTSAMLRTDTCEVAEITAEDSTSVAWLSNP